jgi:deoxyribodipyrimidine photo-lyase
MDKPLRRDFTTRESLVDYLRETFADVVEPGPLSPWRGGRTAALQRLEELKVEDYARTRNSLSGAVSRLSPYIRHGLLTLAEVRQAALQRAQKPQQVEKFIQELGWREYWQRLYSLLGRRIGQSLEPLKTGHPESSYGAQVPDDVAQASTGLACMDAFSDRLQQEGWLHNHARMWLAAYLVHWRKVRWQAGAAWFLRHLLDGDPASNHLSWQWVASSFSHKPYFFNRENLERYTQGRFCRGCPAARTCPFDKSYTELEAQLFGPPGPPGPHRPAVRSTPLRAGLPRPEPEPQRVSTLFWMHGDGLRQAASAPAVFVFDAGVLRHYRLSFKRLVFLYECLLELEVDLYRGRVDEVVLAEASRRGVSQIVTTASPSPGFARLRARLEKHLPVRLVREPEFLPPSPPGQDLTRFSRFWNAR